MSGRFATRDPQTKDHDHVYRLSHPGLRGLRQYRKAVAQLYSLDDRMLRDIGLDRASIPHAAQNGLGR